MKNTSELIKELSKISTPIVYDAIEKYGIRDRCEGYTDSSIKCILPSLGNLCGYACTSKIVGVLPRAERERTISFKDVWRYVEGSQKPSVMVVQDLDDEPRRACAWGDFSASIFKALGCNGAVTNGYVRDIHDVMEIGFQLYASGTIAGHGNIRFIEIDTPVKVGGLVINPGDIIHADVHGVITIPKEIPLEGLIDMINKCLESEAKVISYCNSPGFTLEGLSKEFDAYKKRAGGHFK